MIKVFPTIFMYSIRKVLVSKIAAAIIPSSVWIIRVMSDSNIPLAIYSVYMFIYKKCHVHLASEIRNKKGNPTKCDSSLSGATLGLPFF